MNPARGRGEGLARHHPRDAAGVETTTPYDFVAVCIGHFNERNMLTFPGQETFEAAGGKVMHSSHYTDPRHHQGQEGGGARLFQIRHRYCRQCGERREPGTSPSSYRESVWRVPYFIGGLINFKRILYIRAQENMFPAWQQSAFTRFKHRIAKPFVWANWRGLEALLTIQLKLNKTGLKPKVPIEREINCSVPIVTPGLFDMIADGRIKAVQGSFDHYTADSVVLTGGEVVPADVAVLSPWAGNWACPSCRRNSSRSWSSRMVNIASTGSLPILTCRIWAL